ncbi:MAG: thioredoxin [Deltaproteobacteria bacterium]|nr:thioredoxin [Deltaproteobacteria bacterium]
MALKKLQSKKEYEKAIESGLTLLDFNAPWCAPCRTQEPILERLSIQYEGKATISAMNVDENQDIAATLGIQSVPTMIIFKNNKEIQRFVGVQPENALSDAMDKLL